ncbi:hypothetical protein [Pseudomonas sp. NA-150]|uniref:hypothetical protein n=1 Tax=Pseudomonas sp. NA-150 TaxID=3367525 RepID=UPI0037C6DE53
MEKNTWYLAGPFHRYEDDIKAIAKKNGLRIVDANATDFREDETENPPEVTLRQLLEAHSGVAGEVSGSPQVGFDVLVADNNAVQVLVAGLEAGTIELPDSGELALRLYGALANIRDGMVELTRKHDDLAAENQRLTDQIAAFNQAEALRVAEATESEGLKAKLDAAGVSYRSNASKESLEKLVAELPKP